MEWSCWKGCKLPSCLTNSALTLLCFNGLGQVKSPQDFIQSPFFLVRHPPHQGHVTIPVLLCLPELAQKYTDHLIRSVDTIAHLSVLVLDCDLLCFKELLQGKLYFFDGRTAFLASLTKSYARGDTQGFLSGTDNEVSKSLAPHLFKWFSKASIKGCTPIAGSTVALATMGMGKSKRLTTVVTPDWIYDQQ